MYRFFQDAESDSERLLPLWPATPSASIEAARPVAVEVTYGDMEDDSISYRRPAAG